MTFADYLGFTSLTLLLVGAVNWGVVAIRYAAGDLPTFNATAIDDILKLENMTKYELYSEFKTPDLLDLLKASADVQMFIYWVVFGAGIVCLGFWFGVVFGFNLFGVLAGFLLRLCKAPLLVAAEHVRVCEEPSLAAVHLRLRGPEPEPAEREREARGIARGTRAPHPGTDVSVCKPAASTSAA